MVLLANVGQEEVVLVSAQDRRKIGAQFEANVQKARKSFLPHPMVLLGVVSHVEARFGPFGGSVSLGAR